MIKFWVVPDTPGSLLLEKENGIWQTNAQKRNCTLKRTEFSFVAFLLFWPLFCVKKTLTPLRKKNLNCEQVKKPKFWTYLYQQNLKTYNIFIQLHIYSIEVKSNTMLTLSHSAQTNMSMECKTGHLNHLWHERSEKNRGKVQMGHLKHYFFYTYIGLLVKVSFVSKWTDQAHGDFLFKKPEVNIFWQVFYLWGWQPILLKSAENILMYL